MTTRATSFTRNAIVLTMVIVALVAAGGFVWLIIIWNDPHRANFPWAPIVGMVLALVSIVSFGGFYLEGYSKPHMIEKKNSPRAALYASR
jgi:hypothetical protein